MHITLKFFSLFWNRIGRRENNPIVSTYYVHIYLYILIYVSTKKYAFLTWGVKSGVYSYYISRSTFLDIFHAAVVEFFDGCIKQPLQLEECTGCWDAEPDDPGEMCQAVIGQPWQQCGQYDELSSEAFATIPLGGAPALPVFILWK